MKFLTAVKIKMIKLYREYVQNSAKQKLKQNKALWTTLTDYLKKTSSTGCSFSDYLVLYNYVRLKKPVEILECSTGVSTIILAQAMKDNEQETGVAGRITSMEESKEYYDSARKILPPQLAKYIDLIHSPKTFGSYEVFRGVKYEKIPDRPYDFVFVDGPTTSSLTGDDSFDLDFIEVVKKTKHPVSAIVDCRKSTCYVFKMVFGSNKVKFDHVKSLGFIGPCKQEDLRAIGKIVTTYI